MPHVRDGDLATPATDASASSDDRAPCRAPSEHKQIGTIGVVDLEQRNAVRDALDLLGTKHRHPLVVLGVVADVPGHVLFLEPAEPMLESLAFPGTAHGRARSGLRR